MLIIRLSEYKRVSDDEHKLLAGVYTERRTRVNSNKEKRSRAELWCKYVATKAWKREVARPVLGDHEHFNYSTVYIFSKQVL